MHSYTWLPNYTGNSINEDEEDEKRTHLLDELRLFDGHLTPHLQRLVNQCERRRATSLKLRINMESAQSLIQGAYQPSPNWHSTATSSLLRLNFTDFLNTLPNFICLLRLALIGLRHALMLNEEEAE